MTDHLIACREERDAARAEAKQWEAKWVVMKDAAAAWEALSNARLSERNTARAEAEKLRAELDAVKRQRDELLASSEPVADALRDIAGDGHRAYLDAYESAVASILAASQPAQQPKPEGGVS